MRVLNPSQATEARTERRYSIRRYYCNHCKEHGLSNHNITEHRCPRYGVAVKRNEDSVEIYNNRTVTGEPPDSDVLEIVRL
jgi:hypothetical protein